MERRRAMVIYRDFAGVNFFFFFPTSGRKRERKRESERVIKNENKKERERSLWVVMNVQQVEGGRWLPATDAFRGAAPCAKSPRVSRRSDRSIYVCHFCREAANAQRPSDQNFRFTKLLLGILTLTRDIKCCLHN